MRPFPDDVRQFLEANIDSIDQLETLRILASDPAKEWTAADISKEAQTTQEKMIGHLAAMQARGLLFSEHRAGCTYCRYGPGASELEAKVNRLLQLYQQRPVTMIRMVFEKADEALRTFAEAFRLRKEH